jgi:hypothetical protein
VLTSFSSYVQFLRSEKVCHQMQSSWQYFSLALVLLFCSQAKTSITKHALLRTSILSFAWLILSPALVKPQRIVEMQPQHSMVQAKLQVLTWEYVGPDWPLMVLAVLISLQFLSQVKNFNLSL